MVLLQQFLLLLWKNYVLQKRHKLATITEFVFPAALTLVLVHIRRITPVDYYTEPFAYGEFDLNNAAPLTLLFAPNVSAVKNVMASVAHRLGNNKTGIGFESEEDMEHFIKYGTVDILAGVVFTNMQQNGSFPTNVKYKIRMKARKTKTPTLLGGLQTWLTEQVYPSFQIPGPREMHEQEGGKPGYYAEGFLAVQHAVGVSLTEFIAHKTVTLDVKLQRFPYPPFRDDKFVVALQQWLAMVFMVSYLYPAVSLIKALVHEKEYKLKESMKMMGLNNWLHWAAWFTKTFFVMGISSVLIVTLLCTRLIRDTALLDKADPAVLLTFLLVYCVTCISYCFMISVFFSKANSAATGGGFIWFMAYVPFFFISPRYDSMSWLGKIASCLVSNTAMALGSQLITMYEGTGEGIQWSNFSKGTTPSDTFTLWWVTFMLFMDTAVYLLITWYIDAVCPGDFGIPQTWYFPFTKMYWCSTFNLENADYLKHSKRITNSEFFEKDPLDLYPGIQIRNLCKVFEKHRVAVNQMTLSMYENQITVLLGHNGAGKTTTMSMLTGLIPPSHGTAVISGYDITEQIGVARRNMGLCSQHDVLWPDLTVAEHLYFFAKLKGSRKGTISSQIDDLLKALQLEDKRNSLTVTLSGGMKRKLSVAIALIGGSKVVMLDEPTSGMDPAARRTTWDLLQKERQGRTILLTTHFMDEADLLGDRIAIMSRGEIQCCGTPLFLKKKYGAGYHMIIVKQPGCHADTITQLVQKYVTSAELESNIGAELSYVLPHEEVSTFEKLFTTLEKEKDTLGISSFGASITTMEEVFLRVGEYQNVGEGLKAMLQSTKMWMENFKGDDQEGSVNSILIEGPDGNVMKGSTKLNIGFDLFCQQFWAMLVKRILHTRRNWLLTCAQLAVPLLFIAMTIVVVKTLPTYEHPAPLSLDLQPFEDTIVPVMIRPNITSEPELSRWADVYEKQFQKNNRVVDINSTTTYGYINISDYLLAKSIENLPWFNLHYIVAATFRKDQTTNRSTLVAHFNNQPFHSPGITLSLADSAILRFITNNSYSGFSVINHPFPPSISDTMQGNSHNNVGFLVALNLAFGISILASSFVVFLIKERATKARHLQFVSGVHYVTFWLSTFVWDYVNYLLPCGCILLLLAACEQESYTEGYMQVNYILIFVLYGWSMLPLMYILSFLFKVPSVGFTRLILFNIISGVGTLLVIMILFMPELALHKWAYIYDWIFLMLPNYCLTWAFASLYKNYQILKLCSNPMVKPFCDIAKVTDDCGAFACPEFQDNYLAWDRPGVGRMVVFLIIQGFVFFGIIMLIEMHFVKTIIAAVKTISSHCCPSSDKVYVKLSQDPTPTASDEVHTGPGELVFATLLVVMVYH